ncbi:274_t:CDS:2 [Dentiscutata heterogama]|uniref:274_t:CDS:1 n=1 Tax=Dentiscutata heterogama TaxID=1316150 RepID=A0ACA9JZ47_9GLOM|nr:274_t:CDS:2 [Dentiscutata heterogama]
MDPAYKKVNRRDPSSPQYTQFNLKLAPPLTETTKNTKEKNPTKVPKSILLIKPQEINIQEEQLQENAVPTFDNKESSEEIIKDPTETNLEIANTGPTTAKEKEVKDNSKALEPIPIQKKDMDHLLHNQLPRNELTMANLVQIFVLQNLNTNEKENTHSNIDNKGFITVTNKKKNNKRTSKS